MIYKKQKKLILLFSLFLISFFNCAEDAISSLADENLKIEEENVKISSLIEKISIANNSENVILTNIVIEFKHSIDNSYSDNAVMYLKRNGEDIRPPLDKVEISQVHDSQFNPLIKIDNNKMIISFTDSNIIGGLGMRLTYNNSYTLVLENSPTFIIDKTNYTPEEIDGDIVTFSLSSYSAPGNFILKKTNEMKSSDDFFEQTAYADANSFSRQQMEVAKGVHKLSVLKNAGLTGEGINVAIYDVGIPTYGNFSIQNAVVFNYPFVDKEYEKNLSFRKIDSHAHRMAAYMLDYAYKINIYSIMSYGNLMFTNQYPEHYYYYMLYHDGDDLLNKNKVDIISASYYSSFDDNKKKINDHLKAMISRGLIYNNSIGNDGHLNTLDQYKYKQNFLPYLLDLDSLEGAYVMVQAVVKDDALYKSIRSKAGDLRFYTVSVIENGNGATSQATATFSGMLAMLMQYNKENNKGYTPREIVEIIIETCDDIRKDNERVDNVNGDGVDDVYGHGLVNLEAAFNKIKTGNKPTYKLYQETALKNLKATVKAKLNN